MHSHSGCLHFLPGFKRAQRATAGMMPGASVQQLGTYQPWLPLPLPLPLPASLMACTAGGGPTLARASARRRASSFATSSSSFTC